jgi:hypothetical protein
MPVKNTGFKLASCVFSRYVNRTVSIVGTTCSQQQGWGAVEVTRIDGVYSTWGDGEELMARSFTKAQKRRVGPHTGGGWG